MRPFHSTMLLAPMRRIYAIDLVFVRGFILLTALVIAVLGGVGIEGSHSIEQIRLNRPSWANWARLIFQLHVRNWRRRASCAVWPRFIPSGIPWRSRNFASPPKSSLTA